MASERGECAGCGRVRALKDVEHELCRECVANCPAWAVRRTWAWTFTFETHAGIVDTQTGTFRASESALPYAICNASPVRPRGNWWSEGTRRDGERVTGRRMMARHKRGIVRIEAVLV